MTEKGIDIVLSADFESARVLESLRDRLHTTRAKAQRMTKVILGLVIALLISVVLVFAQTTGKTKLQRQNALLSKSLEYSDTQLIKSNAINEELTNELNTLKMAEPEVTTEAVTIGDTPVKVTYMGEYTITYYCPEEQCSEEWGSMTATGVTAQEGVTVAVDPSVIPYGTWLYIEGLGYRIAQDCGGAIKGNKIDVYVDSHEDENGIHRAKVYVLGGITNEE